MSTRHTLVLVGSNLTAGLLTDAGCYAYNHACVTIVHGRLMYHTSCMSNYNQNYMYITYLYTYVCTRQQNYNHMVPNNIFHPQRCNPIGWGQVGTGVGKWYQFPTFRMQSSYQPHFQARNQYYLPVWLTIDCPPSPSLYPVAPQIAPNIHYLIYTLQLSLTAALMMRTYFGSRVQPPKHNVHVCKWGEPSAETYTRVYSRWTLQS